MSEKKLMLGHKVRRLRRQENLSQAQMAADLDISAAYLNLIEHNQRPVSAQVLIKLASAYDLDLASFAKDDEAELIQRFHEIFADPSLQEIKLAKQDLRDLAALSPEVVTAIQIMSDRIKQQREQLQSSQAMDMDSQHLEAYDPNGEVRDFFHEHANHFPDLEALASDIRRTAGLNAPRDNHQAVEALSGLLNMRVQLMPMQVMGSILRRYDIHQRRLMLNEVMDHASQAFQIAVQLVLEQHRSKLDQVLGPHPFHHRAAPGLARQGLANYAASAVLMPYQRFLQAAEELRHDIDLLAQRFCVKREQVAHRLTTLQRPGAKGIPFFLIRMDRAGNVSKRFAAGGFHFARQGGTCPRWHLHDPPTPSMDISTQVVELPEGTRYFSLAIPCRKPGLGHHEPGQPYMIGLGCHLDLADRLVYADGLDLEKVVPTPIGITCRLCERLSCTHRAFPPVNHPISADDTRRELVPFVF